MKMSYVKFNFNNYINANLKNKLIQFLEAFEDIFDKDYSYTKEILRYQRAKKKLQKAWARNNRNY